MDDEGTSAEPWQRVLDSELWRQVQNRPGLPVERREELKDALRRLEDELAIVGIVVRRKRQEKEAMELLLAAWGRTDAALKKRGVARENLAAAIRRVESLIAG